MSARSVSVRVAALGPPFERCQVPGAKRGLGPDGAFRPDFGACVVSRCTHLVECLHQYHPSFSSFYPRACRVSRSPDSLRTAAFVSNSHPIIRRFCVNLAGRRISRSRCGICPRDIRFSLAEQDAGSSWGMHKPRVRLSGARAPGAAATPQAARLPTKVGHRLSPAKIESPWDLAVCYIGIVPTTCGCHLRRKTTSSRCPCRCTSCSYLSRRISCI